MKIKILLLLILFCCIALNALAQKNVMVVAHRGDWRNEPENSLRGFISAANMGVDVVELDLQKTKDGELVIMHDGTIDRTTNGHGSPADYTLAELKKFRLKNGQLRVTEYNDIPTLREVMTALKDKHVKVNLDKSYPYFNDAYAILQETGTVEQVIFKSDVTFADLKAKYPALVGKITYMPVINLDRPDAHQIINDYLTGMKLYAFELIFSKDTSAILTNNSFITKTGAKLWVNSLWPSLNGHHDDDMAVEMNNPADSWDWLLNHGFTVIQTDRPKELLAYLKRNAGDSACHFFAKALACSVSCCTDGV